MIPYSAYIPYILEQGFRVQDLWNIAIMHPITQFYVADLFLAAAVIVVWMIYESRRLRMTYAWIPVLSIFCIGLSFGLPFFLYQRERILHKHI